MDLEVPTVELKDKYDAIRIITPDGEFEVTYDGHETNIRTRGFGGLVVRPRVSNVISIREERHP